MCFVTIEIWYYRLPSWPTRYSQMVSVQQFPLHKWTLWLRQIRLNSDALWAVTSINKYVVVFSVAKSKTLILKSLAHTVVKAPKSCHIIPILLSLHWLRITERIENKLLSLNYKVLTTTQPPYSITSSLFNVLAVLALHPSLLLLGHRHNPL